MKQEAGTAAPQDDRVVSPGGSVDAAFLGTLRFRAHVVHVYAGQRYTVKRNDGTVIAEYVTRGELARRAPDVHQALTPLLAGPLLATSVGPDSTVEWSAVSEAP